MKYRRRSLLTFVAALVGLFAIPANAQVCTGVPLAIDQWALRGSVGFPSYGKEFSGGVTTRQSRWLTLDAGYAVTMYEYRDIALANHHYITADAAWSLVGLANRSGLAIDLCPVVGVALGTLMEGVTVTVPFGASIGVAIPVRDSLSIHPFVNAGWAWLAWVPDEGDARTQRFRRYLVGANADIGRFLVGARYGNERDDGPAYLGLTLTAKL